MIDEFKIGEYVLYAKDGVCLVEDIAPLDFSPDKPYYILKPVNSKGSTVYVPTDSEKLVSKMHRLMNKAEIDDLLLNTRGKVIKWIDSKTERTEYFNEIIAEANRQKLVLLVRCLYLKRSERLSEKKHLCASDESILKTAEKLIREEFAYALSCSEDSVGDYIRAKLNVAR